MALREDNGIEVGMCVCWCWYMGMGIVKELVVYERVETVILSET